MGHVQTSYLIPDSRERVFEYLTDLRRLAEDLHPVIELSFALSEEASLDGGQLKSDAGVPVWPQVATNAEVPLAIRRLGLTAHGLVRIESCQPPTEIVYIQESGWFKSWRHAIELVEHSDGQRPVTLVSDVIDYQLPMGILGTLADDLFLKRDVQRILHERAQRMIAHFESQSATGEIFG